MALDMNRILLYAAPDGTLGEKYKRYFSLVDGIIGMEGNGPVAGKPMPSGLIVAGYNPLATDMVCTKLIGFDYQKMPMLYRAFDHSSYPFANFSPGEISIVSNKKEIQGNFSELFEESLLRFEPHFGWKGYVEL